MRTKIMLAILILLSCLAGLSGASLEIAYIVGDTNTVGEDTVLIELLQDRLSYNIDLIDDAAVDTISNITSLYDGMIISNSALSPYVASLKDSLIGIMTLDRYTENEFGFGTSNYLPAGHGRRLVNQRETDFICDPYLDTIFPYQYDNQYLYYYCGVPSGAMVPFNKPEFASSDTACMILLDSGTALAGGGTAAGRRTFSGIHTAPELMDWCNSRELFCRLAAWTFSDTANPVFSEYSCWACYREVEACWGEILVSTDDSATYTSDFRFGYDYGPILSFWRLTEPWRKVVDGYCCDSLRLKFPIIGLGFNETPLDSIMDIRIDAFRIIHSTKWHAPPPNDGGDPYTLDSTWVTRWDVVSGSNPVSWDTLDLRAGIDYDSLPLDTFRLQYPRDSIGDLIEYLIPGSVLDSWSSDTSGNNGLVFKVTLVYDSSSNIEYGTRAPYHNTVSSPMKVEAFYSAVPDDPYPPAGPRNIISTGILSCRENSSSNYKGEVKR